MTHAGYGAKPADAITGRLGVRFALPLLSGLLLLPLCMLAMGYQHAKLRILDEATARIQRLEAFVERQDYTSRQLVEKNAAAVIFLLEEAGPDTIFEPSGSLRQELEKRIDAILQTNQGVKEVLVYLEDGERNMRGTRFSRDEHPASFSPPEKEFRNVLFTAIGGRPVWQTRIAGQNGSGNELLMSYCAPLHRKQAGNVYSRFGVVLVNLSTPWFVGRVQSLSAMDGSAIFFMAQDGAWTLPVSSYAGDETEKASLARLSDNMREERQGHMPVTWNGLPYVGVHLPLLTKDLVLGALIPEERLFGSLDNAAVMLAGATAVFAALVLLCLLRTSAVILRPVRELKIAASRLMRGDFTGSAKDRTKGSRAAGARHLDEPARLRAAIDVLRGALRRREKDLTLLTVARERLFGEMELAGKIQRAICRTKLPEADNIVLAAELHPAGEICGEITDCFFRTPDVLCCIMGSVAARGVPAALLMDRVIPLLHELLLSGLSPGQALENANSIIDSYGTLDKSDLSPLVRVFLGALRRRDGVFTWACAGKNPPYRIFAGKVTQLNWSGDLPLGAKSDARYRNQETRLSPGETVFLCSERLTAVPDACGGMYGENRLLALLSAHTGDPGQMLRDVHESVLAHAGGERLTTDVAMLALRWLGSMRV